MKFKYSLVKDDLLQYQLFSFSQRKSTKNRQLLLTVIFPTVYLLIGVYLYVRTRDIFTGVFFIVIGVLWYFFYPKYANWRYKRHFQAHVNRLFAGKEKLHLEVNFQGAEMHLEDEDSNSTIKKSAFTELVQTPEHFFLIQESGYAIVFPKRENIRLAELETAYQGIPINFVDAQDWQW